MNTQADPAKTHSSHAGVGLTLSAVVQASLDVIGERGVAGLTMSSVADRLGVQAPSLYHHVASKQALLELVASHALGSLDEDRTAYAAVSDLDAWMALTTDGSLRLRRFYLAHLGLAALMQATALPGRDASPGPRGLLAAAQIAALVRLGIPRPQARNAFLTCSRWTLAAVAADSSGGPSGDEATFELGLRWLLSGLRNDLAATLDISGAGHLINPPTPMGRRNAFRP